MGEFAEKPAGKIHEVDPLIEHLPPAGDRGIAAPFLLHPEPAAKPLDRRSVVRLEERHSIRILSPDDSLDKRQAIVAAIPDVVGENAQSAGYGCYLIAVIAFFVGFATSYPTALVVVIVAGLAVGSLLLLPSIILGYAVKAAEREDREQGR